MTAPIVRQRAKHAKVRTGCHTCRARHVKCDEERPKCKRCEKAGKLCAGYDLGADRRKDDLVVARPTFRSLAVLAGTLNDREKMAVNYFRLEAIRDLPGSEWLMGWDRLVLPLFQTEPTVLHAAAAVAALQRALSPFLVSPNRAEDLRFALLQYNKTISSLVSSIEALAQQRSTSTAEVILVVSLLLFTFDMLQGNVSRANVHLRGGMKTLCYQLQSAPWKSEHGTEGCEIVLRTDPRSPIELLAHSYVRLDADLSLTAGDNPFLYPSVDRYMPSSFSSLREAVVHLDAIERDVGDTWCEMFKLAQDDIEQFYPSKGKLEGNEMEILITARLRTVSLDPEPGIHSRIEAIEEALVLWKSAFAAISVAGKENMHWVLVQTQFFYLWVAVKTWRDHDEQPTDLFFSEFNIMLDLMALYIKQHRSLTRAPTPNRDPKHTNIRPLIAVGTSLGAALRMIIARCRDSLLRRKAISLLREMDMRGVLESEILPSFYEALVDFEESLAREMTDKPGKTHFECNQIPAAARILESGLEKTELFDAADNNAFGRMTYVVIGDDRELAVQSQVFAITNAGLVTHLLDAEPPD